MVKRSYLLDLFDRVAAPKGWQICENKFPSDIPEKVFPEPENIFKALSLLSPSEVKFLILGQDPYFSSTNGYPDATGVAFAVSKNAEKRPRSLIRIMAKVYHGEEGNPELTDWVSERGVLLLNAALTVPQGGERESAGKHLKYWKEFVTSTIRQVKRDSPKAVFIAWGRKSESLMGKALRQIDGNVRFIPAHHPVASTKGDESFNRFWNKEGIHGKLEMPLS